MKKLIMALVCISSAVCAKTPTWAISNTTRLNGSVVTTVCHGVGPSLDIARTDALTTCQTSASQFLRTNINVKMLTVESEKSVGFHQVVSSDEKIQGLVCNPKNDQVEELESQFKVWLQCEFDLKNVKTSSVDKSDKISNEHLNTLKISNVEIVKDEKPKIIFISTVPQCESIIIRGKRPRTVECAQNPLSISVFDDDVEAIVRAKGFKPKTIFIKELPENEKIQILFDLL